MLNWTKVHKEFSVAYSISKELQKEFLITNGLLGLYDSSFAKFTAKNITDMGDEQNLNLDAVVDKRLGVIVVPEMLQLEEGDSLKTLAERGEDDNN